MNKQQKKNQILIIAIFSMTIIPFLIAWGLKENPSLVKGTTNRGQLVVPPITIPPEDILGFDDFSSNNIKELRGHWLIVNVIPNEGCNEICLEALLKTKQLRLMLNKELPRTRRVAIIIKNPSEEISNQWWLKDTLLWRLNRPDDKESQTLYSSLLHEDNKIDTSLIDKLIKNENKEVALNSDLIRVKVGAEFINKIAAVSKGGISDGMLFLIDPLGNLMMQYESGFNTYKVKDDLMHLLRISQIG
ncbi:MAG: hypothetical protein NTY69_07530 [Methylococcales bacterium]|nr:hypothetical protein [Methylococcales bacterium]